jgi:hypothetical protein
MQAHKIRGRSITNVFELSSTLQSLEDETGTIKAQASGKISGLVKVALQYNTVGNSAIGDFFASAIANLNSRTSDASVLVTAGNNALPTVSAAATAAQSTSNAQLMNEVQSRNSAKTSLDSTSTNLANSISTMASAAVVDRASIRARGLANTPQMAVSTLTSSALAGEASRNTAESSTITALLSTARAALAQTRSASFASEFSRINASCSNQVATLPSGYSAPVQSGANDWGTW